MPPYAGRFDRNIAGRRKCPCRCENHQLRQPPIRLSQLMMQLAMRNLALRLSRRMRLRLSRRMPLRLSRRMPLAKKDDSLGDLGMMNLTLHLARMNTMVNLPRKE